MRTEHKKLHYKARSKKMSELAKKGLHYNQTPEAREKARQRQLEKIRNGTHHTLKKEFREKQRQIALRKLKEGTHCTQQEGYSEKMSEVVRKMHKEHPEYISKIKDSINKKVENNTWHTYKDSFKQKLSKSISGDRHYRRQNRLKEKLQSVNNFTLIDINFKNNLKFDSFEYMVESIVKYINTEFKELELIKQDEKLYLNPIKNLAT